MLRKYTGKTQLKNYGRLSIRDQLPGTSLKLGRNWNNVSGTFVATGEEVPPGRKRKNIVGNFLHWMPTAMSSEIEDGTIHQDENPNIIRLACGGNKNCVEKTDIHGIVTKLLDRKYNSSVDESIEFQLYSEHNNPLPLMDVIDEIFAMSLTGTVNVYIKRS